MDKYSYEQKIRKNRIIWFGASIIALIGGMLIGGGIIKFLYRKYDDPNIQKIIKTYELMQNSWYFGKDYENLDNMITDAAVNGILSSGDDPYTFYTSSMEEQGLSSSRLGFGISHAFYGGNRYISKVYSDSPAESAGIKKGDVLLGFYDGSEYIEFKNYARNEATDKLNAYESDTVKFKGIFSGEEKEIEVRRGAYSTSDFDYETILDNGEVTAYLDLENFLNLYQTGTQATSILEEASKAGDLKKVIIDLRDNGGGYVQASVDFASIFLDDRALVLTYEYADGRKQNIYANKLGDFGDVEDIVILQNYSTASASETFEVALRDHLKDKVTIIGTTSYGKGIAQDFLEFDDGSVIRYTMAKTFSPDGYSIHGTGITPDIAHPIDRGVYLTYYGDVSNLSPENLASILKQINVALSSSYTTYLDGLHALKEYLSLEVNDVFDRTTAQGLQKMIWDGYIAIEEEMYQSALGV